MKKLLYSIAAISLSIGVLPALAMASEAGEAAGAAGSGFGDLPLFRIAIAAGIGLGLSVIGGALGQGKAAAAALEGIARNPGAAGKITTPMIIGLAMIESLVIYSLVVSFLLLFLKLV